MNVYRQYNTNNFSVYFELFDGYFVDNGVIGFSIHLIK